MDFGKLEQTDQVDFSFKNEPSINSMRLGQLDSSSKSPKIHLGGTAWTVKEWKGNVYPEKIKPNEFLEHYSKQFGTIEFNTTHYRIPSIEQVQKWYDQSNDAFKFCPKIPQSISHRNISERSIELMESFTNTILHLKEKLGCSFLQLPPYFGPDRWKLLQGFLKKTSLSLPLAIEFRNELWYKSPNIFEEQMNWLHENGFYPCITDVAGRRDVLHLQLAGDRLCIRFVGTGEDKIDFKRLDLWTEKLKSWIDQGLQEVYFFLHHPNNIKAAEQSVYLQKLLNSAIPELNCKGPNLNLGAESQMKLF
ncbi:MAG: DUF72 domain-containing protein [Saprospiraceae bacterium]|nr:DUF72 domain-containing protein [Saprospiraceae bacterium]